MPALKYSSIENEEKSNKIQHEIEIWTNEISKTINHLPRVEIRPPVECLLFTAAVISFCFSRIGISIKLWSFGLIDRVAGVATGATIAAIRLQILEWHGGMIL
jgi:hypothetical protein